MYGFTSSCATITEERVRGKVCLGSAITSCRDRSMDGNVVVDTMLVLSNKVWKVGSKWGLCFIGWKS